MPNLKVADYVLPDTIMTSQNVALKFTTTNAGEWDAGQTTTRIYLSSDNQYDNKDTELGTVAVGSLQKGTSTTLTATISVADKNTGKWYVLICTDAHKQVNEMDENDNLTAIPVTVLQSPLPDLTVTDLTTDEELTSGQPMNIRKMVKNIGQHATRSNKWSDT